MDPALVGDQYIDREIAAVRVSIEALRHRRSLLSHTLLSSRKLKLQLKRGDENRSVSRAAFETAQELVAEQEDVAISNLYRTCAGITAFRVQDPDPNAVDNGKVLGLRFEVFSAHERAFQVPYYILLNQPESGNGQFKIHKHTIPVFIPLQTLVKQYLPFNTDEYMPSSGAQQVQDLARFARALRKELIAHHKRVAVYEQLKQQLKKSDGVEDVKMLDATGKVLEIIFTNRIIARIRVTGDGKIEKTAVGPTVDANPSQHSMKAYREIRSAIEGGDGRIEMLSKRLRLRSKS